HRGELAGRVDVPARGDADAAGDGRGEVGDDVTEEVVGDDDVEALGLGDQEDGGRVDVQVVGGDLGVLRGHPVEGVRPQVAREGQHVVLVDQGELLARAGLGAGERVTDDSLDAVGRVDGDLGGDLVLGARADGAAVAGVRALGALADHDEVDLRLAGQ